MKYFLLLSVLIVHTRLCFAQKPLLDTGAFSKWTSVGGAAISNDGNYVSYRIENQPLGSLTLVLEATTGNWKREIPGGTGAFISSDSRLAVFLQKDSLGIITLGASSIEYIPHIRSFKLPKKGGWLVYQLNGPSGELMVRNLSTGDQRSFGVVMGYWLNEEGNALLLQTVSKKDSVVTQSLDWVNLVAGGRVTIWGGTRAGNIVFDETGNQLAFIAGNNVNNQVENSLWYYKTGTDRAVRLAGDRSAGIDTGLRLDKIRAFSKDGSRLFIDLKEKDHPKAKPDAVQVDVWSYTDIKLQSEQLFELNTQNPLFRRSDDYTAIIDISDSRIIRLEREDERISQPFPLFDAPADDVMLIKHQKGSGTEVNWNENAFPSFYLVSTRNGARKPVNKINDSRVVPWYQLSPGGKYMIYYDARKKNYFGYEVATGVTRNITMDIAVNWTSGGDMPGSSYYNIRVEGWTQDNAALIYDRYDIWKVDMQGNKTPICITNGYGRKHNVVFRLGMKDYSGKAIANDERLILSAFNKRTKENGFYAKTMNEKGDPELLTMGPYLYYAPGAGTIATGSSPQKARDAEVYIVKREGATQAPNFFCTRDFKNFTSLSDIHPEKSYNWFTTELITWKTLNGEVYQGVLYKPEDFNPKNKYPLIFHYYDKLSQELNVYHIPQVSEGDVEIPWFVSNGYLIFTPDIHYKLGETGKSALNAVVSAAGYLSKMPWVDASRMGIQGGSFGGYETDYLITHTTIFAAACSRSGFSDLISNYGETMLEGGSPFGRSWAENGQGRIGTTLWLQPHLFIENSPIFRVDKVTTPLLMMNNKADGVVNFSQGVEFFTALRRLGKKAWMLQYDGGVHLVYGKASIDYNTRLIQFFDHYLKGAPAPKWMVEGIPARLKGIDTGLELDRSGKTP